MKISTIDRAATGAEYDQDLRLSNCVPSSGVNSDRARGAAGVERQDGRRCGQAGIETAGEPAHPLSSVEPQHRNSIGFARVSERPAATRSARASNVLQGGK